MPSGEVDRLDIQWLQRVLRQDEFQCPSLKIFADVVGGQHRDARSDQRGGAHDGRLVHGQIRSCIDRCELLRKIEAEIGSDAAAVGARGVHQAAALGQRWPGV